MEGLAEGGKLKGIHVLGPHHPQPSPAPSVVGILSLGIHSLNHRD